MGCVAAKTNHVDGSETESEISTVSLREKKLSYDDYWNEQDRKEEREIEAELEGKKLPSEKSPPKYSPVPKSKGNKVSAPHKSRKQASLNKEKVSHSLINSVKQKDGNGNSNGENTESEINDKKRQSDLNTSGAEKRDRQAQENSVDESKKVPVANSGKHSANGSRRGNKVRANQTSASKNRGKAGSEKTNSNTETAKAKSKENGKANGDKKEKLKDRIQNNSKAKESKNEADEVKKNGSFQNGNSLKETIENQDIPEDREDSVDGTVLQEKRNSDDDSIIDKSDKDTNEDIKMGNAESDANVKVNGHAESPDKDTEATAEEQSDDHHVHWKDDNKVVNSPGKASVRAVSAKLMPQPSERVMSAHARRGSARQSAGKERRMSRAMSARKDRSSSARYSARRQRQGGKAASETNGKDINNTEYECVCEVLSSNNASVHRLIWTNKLNPLPTA